MSRRSLALFVLVVAGCAAPGAMAEPTSAPDAVAVASPELLATPCVVASADLVTPHVTIAGTDVWAPLIGPFAIEARTTPDATVLMEAVTNAPIDLDRAALVVPTGGRVELFVKDRSMEVSYLVVARPLRAAAAQAVALVVRTDDAGHAIFLPPAGESLVAIAARERRACGEVSATFALIVGRTGR